LARDSHRHNIVDPFEDTESRAGTVLARTGDGVTTSSIRSRILKEWCGGAGRFAVGRHNIVDPFEDTEREYLRLPLRVRPAVTTSSIRSRILKERRRLAAPRHVFPSQHRRSVRGY